MTTENDTHEQPPVATTAPSEPELRRMAGRWARHGVAWSDGMVWVRTRPAEDHWHPLMWGGKGQCAGGRCLANRAWTLAELVGGAS